MEDGGVDTTVIERLQLKMGQMADFLHLLASSVFLFIKTWCISHLISDLAARIDEFSYHNFILKICGPIIENEYLWVCTKFMCLHIPIFLLCIKTSLKLPLPRRHNLWTPPYVLWFSKRLIVELFSPRTRKSAPIWISVADNFYV